VNNNQIGSIVNNAIMTTALLANEVCIQTKGEFLFHEQDYSRLVGNFQIMISKKIMPPKTQQDLRNEITKYITDILKQLNEEKSNDNTSGTSVTDTESKSIDIGDREIE
jgi:hypothetical protein